MALSAGVSAPARGTSANLTHGAVDHLPTVVSTNLCADLLLLGIAAPEQILSVSRQSQNSSVSPVAGQARRYPGNRGGVEEVLHLKPDIVLVYTGWTGRRHAELLARQGINVIALPYPRRWDDAHQMTREMAVRIGRDAAGEVRVAAAEQRLQQLLQMLAQRRQTAYSALYLRPSGGTAGTGTYVDDLLTRLGLRNAAAEQQISGWGRLPLERLISAPPELLLLGYFDSARPWASSAYGRHPVLQALMQQRPTINLPGNAWGCGGLELIDVAEQLVEALGKLPADICNAPNDH